MKKEVYTTIAGKLGC